MKKVKISSLKKGDYFHKYDASRAYSPPSLYAYLGRVRVYDMWGAYKGWGYSYSNTDDIGDYQETRKDRYVWVD